MSEYGFTEKMTKILLVDDNEQLRIIFKIMLKSFQVFEAKNGFEAIEAYKIYKPDLILMDILMPDMDGIVATKKIKEINDNVKILAITAYFSRADEIIKVGALEVLKKPIRKEELINKINHYLNAQIS